jgi:hypothetical protein
VKVELWSGGREKTGKERKFLADVGVNNSDVGVGVVRDVRGEHRGHVANRLPDVGDEGDAGIRIWQREPEGSFEKRQIRPERKNKM